MSSFSRVCKFALVVEDRGRLLQLAPRDIYTQEWLVENQSAVFDIIRDISNNHINQKSDKWLAYTVANEYCNAFRYAFPYERFEVNAGEYKEQVVVFGFVEYK